MVICLVSLRCSLYRKLHNELREANYVQLDNAHDKIITVFLQLFPFWNSRPFMSTVQCSQTMASADHHPRCLQRRLTCVPPSFCEANTKAQWSRAALRMRRRQWHRSLSLGDCCQPTGVQPRSASSPLRKGQATWPGGVRIVFLLPTSCNFLSPAPTYNLRKKKKKRTRGHGVFFSPTTVICMWLACVSFLVNSAFVTLLSRMLCHSDNSHERNKESFSSRSSFPR